MNRMSLNLLGPVQVSWEAGRPPRFRSPTAVALLGYLVMESRPVSRPALTALFWPDLSEAQARGELRRTLHNLSTILPGCFQATHQTITFALLPNCRLDTLRFRELSSREDDVTALMEAAALYRASFLEGLFLEHAPEVEAWLLAERERWRLVAVGVLERLTALHTRKGAYAQAVEAASRLLELDAWREESHRQLMRLFARTGRWNAALNQYQLCAGMLARELGVMPTPETTALYERIQAARSAPRHNLPPERTPFIGRQAELEQIVDRLRRPDCWLLSIVGPGGVGKTRLARQAAALLAGDFLNGVRYVPLTAVSSPAFLPTAIAEALGLAAAPRPSLREQMLRHLRRQELLLLLDNVEHLLEGVELLVEILEAAPEVKLLVTSRERMNLRQEWVFTLEGLPYPAEAVPPEQLFNYPAVELFAQNAGRARHDFSLSAEVEAVAYVCRLLEGSPLGIELAAALVPTLSCREIGMEIGRNLDILTAARRGLPPRHYSLRAVFDHSWQLLSAEEQQVLRLLAVFSGGFTLATANRVAGLTPAILAALLAKSFLREVETPAGPMRRYDLHAILHHYVAEALADRPQEQEDAERQHAHTFAELLAAQEGRFITALAEVKAALLPEIDNLRLAWQRAVEAYDWDLVGKMLGSLHNLYDAQGWFQEGHDLLLLPLSAAESRPPPELLRGRLLVHSAAMLVRLGQVAEADRQARQGLALLEPAGSPAELGFALNTLGVVQLYAGHFDDAAVTLRTCIDLYRRHHYEAEAVRPLANLGNLYGRQGSYSRSLEILGEGLALCRKLGDRRGMALFLNNLAGVHLMSGNAAAAKQYLEACLPIAEEVGHYQSKLVALQNLAEIHLDEGALAAAAAAGAESAALARRLNDRPNLARSLKLQGMVEMRAGRMAQAGEHLREGMEVAYATQAMPALLDVLEGVAAWLAATERERQAVQLAHYILEHPATERQYRDKAQALLDRLTLPLASEELAAVRQWTPGKVVNQLLLLLTTRL